LEDESTERWVCVMLKMENPPEWIPVDAARQGWGIDFRETMPIKKEGQ
jgi:hypothetical protein